MVQHFLICLYFCDCDVTPDVMMEQFKGREEELVQTLKTMHSKKGKKQEVEESEEVRSARLIYSVRTSWFSKLCLPCSCIYLAYYEGIRIRIGGGRIV